MLNAWHLTQTQYFHQVKPLMKFHILSRFLPLAIFVHTSVAVGTHDQVGRDINYGTFQNPSSTVRPRFRYWTNDASVNLSRVVEDVKSMASVGAGGLEVLGYYLYGDEYGYLSAIVQSDWTIYGFGSTAWSEYSIFPPSAPPPLIFIVSHLY